MDRAESKWQTVTRLPGLYTDCELFLLWWRRSFRGQTIVIDSCKFQQSSCPPATVPFADSAVSSPPLSAPKFVCEARSAIPRSFSIRGREKKKKIGLSGNVIEGEQVFSSFFVTRARLDNPVVFRRFERSIELFARDVCLFPNFLIFLTIVRLIVIQVIL